MSRCVIRETVLERTQRTKHLLERLHSVANQLVDLTDLFLRRLPGHGYQGRRLSGAHNVLRAQLRSGPEENGGAATVSGRFDGRPCTEASTEPPPLPNLPAVGRLSWIGSEGGNDEERTMRAGGRRSDLGPATATDTDPQAFGELNRRHERAVLAYSVHWARVPEVAADLTAETFAAALDSIATGQADGGGGGGLSVWHRPPRSRAQPQTRPCRRRRAPVAGDLHARK